MIAAIAGTVRLVSGSYMPNSLNAILLAPDALYAISWHDPERIPYASIRERGSPEDPEGYFNLAYQPTPEAVVVGSTGWPQEGWNVIPNGSVLKVARNTLATSVVALLPADHSCARGVAASGSAPSDRAFSDRAASGSAPSGSAFPAVA
jgi:hypothetical protein